MAKKTAKKAAKKPAAKKAAGKRKKKLPLVVSRNPAHVALEEARKRQQEAPAKADLHAYSEEVKARIRAAEEKKQKKLASQKKKPAHAPTRFMSLGDYRKGLIELPNIAMKWMLGSWGVPFPGVVEILGDGGTGKSTLAALMCSKPMMHPVASQRAMVLYISCEDKPLTVDRWERVFPVQRDLAAALARCVIMARATTLAEFERALIEGLQYIRIDLGHPMTAPIIVIGDPITALMSKKERAGLASFGSAAQAEEEKKEEEEKEKDAKKKGKKSAGTDSKFVSADEMTNKMAHAQWSALLARRLPHLLEEFQALLIVTKHQMCNVDMHYGSQQAQLQMSRKNAELQNTTALGGKALAQRELLTIILAKSGKFVQPVGNWVSGEKIAARVHKFSYGPSLRTMEWELRTEHLPFDTPEHLDPALHFEQLFPFIMINGKYLGTRVVDRKISCNAGKGHVYAGLDYEDYYALLNNVPELEQLMAAELGFVGYQDVQALLLGDSNGQAEVGDPEDEDASEEEEDGAGEEDDQNGT